MAIKEHLIIKLRINGKEYPLKVKLKDEKFYRDAADIIEKKISDYRNCYSGADIRVLDEADYAIMTSIQAVSKFNSMEEENKTFEDKIIALTQELDEYLKQ